MRQLLPALLSLLVVSAPTSAQDGGRYVNEHYGFEARVPAGFVVTYSDSETVILASPDGRREIALLGGYSFYPLEALAERHMTQDAERGWNTRLQSSTPSWVAYAGTRNGQQVHVRMIDICPQRQFARLQVTYPERDAVDVMPMLDSLGTSFRPTGTATCRD